MSIKNNVGVIKSWLNGKAAMNSGNSLHTDGTNLYSYALLIGSRPNCNERKIWNYTSSGSFISHTTSCHVGLTIRVSLGSSLLTLIDPSV